MYAQKSLKSLFKDIYDTATIISAKENVDQLAASIKRLSAEQAAYKMVLAGCNDEQMRNAFYANHVADEEFEQAIATATNTVAKEANTKATNKNTVAKAANLSFTNLLKAAWAKLNAVMMANPILAVTAGVAILIAGLAKLCDILTVTVEEAKEAASKSKEAFEKVNSEVESVNNELKTTQQRIDELNAKENLSLGEAEELQRLKETNAELEREMRIKQELADEAKKDANKDAVKYFNTKTDGVNTVYLLEGAEAKEQVSILDAVKQRLEKIEELNQKVNSLTAERNEIEESDKDYKKNPEWFKLDEQIKVYEPMISEYKGFINSNISDFMEMDDSLVEGMDNGLLSQLEEVYQTYDEVINGVAQSHENAIAGILEKVDFKGTKERLVELVKSGSLSVEKLSSQFHKLTEYLDDAGISAEELYQYIMALAGPDAIDYRSAEAQLRDALGTSGAYLKAKRAGITTHEGLKAFLQVKTKFKGQTDAWTVEDWIAHVQDVLNASEPTVEIDILSVSVDKLNTRLKPAMDSLKSAWNKIWTTDDGKTKFSLKDAVDVSDFASLKKELDGIKENLKLSDEAIDLSAFDHFYEVLQDTSSTEEQVKEAFNGIADVIVKAAVIGTEDFNTLKETLSELGVANNEIVAFGELLANTEAFDTVLSKANLTMEDFVALGKDGEITATTEAEAFLEEMVGAENLGQALAVLQLKQMLVNNTLIDESSDINQIMALAEAAGIGAEAITQLANAKNILNRVESGEAMSSDVINGALRTVENFNKTLLDWKPTVNFDGIDKSAKKAGSKSGDAYVEAFEAELQDLQTLRDNGVIGEREYLDRLRALYQKYFADKKQYLYQYQKYEKEYLEGMKSLYEQAFSYITSQIDKRISSLQDEKEAATDAIDAQIKGIDEQIKAVNKERDAKLKAIEDEQKALKEQQKMLDKQIKAKQDEIDAIQDAADERDRELTLAKAMYEMERMKNQRTRLVKKIARIYSNVYIESNYIG